MRYDEQVGFAVKDCLKPATRRSCSLMRNYIIQYILWNYPDMFNSMSNDDYKAILNLAIDRLERNGYLSLADLNLLIDDAFRSILNKSSYDEFKLWFEES